MQSLPTEAVPLSHCSQCGARVRSGSGSPTFVYGVGAVGHQSCDACGAKWRYLWHEQATVVKRSRRPFAVIGGLLLIGALGAVAVVAFRGSAKQYDATATTTSTSSTRPSVTIAPVGTVDAASGAEFVSIYGPANVAKTTFMRWLLTTAPATPQFDVNQRVTEFVSSQRQSQVALTSRTWPKPASADITKLARAYGSFLDNVDLLRYGLLYSASFSVQLKAESQAVKDIASAVRRDLGLPPTP